MIYDSNYIKVIATHKVKYPDIIQTLGKLSISCTKYKH